MKRKRMRPALGRHVAALLVFLLLVSALGGPAYAQDYSFAVPELLMQVYVQSDSSVRIVYDITFENYGSPIDIVDIGTPHSGYNIGNMSASIDGVPLTDIRRSEYVNPGVEVHLDGNAIPRGGRGTLHFEMTMPEMIFTDTTNEENASLQITPTWFDSDLVRGTGTIEIRVTMLEGIQLDEVLYQDVPFTDKGTENGRVVTVWRFENVTPTQAYRVGVSFPQRGLTNVTKVTTWDLFTRWLGEAAGAIGVVAGACLPIAVPIFIFWVIIRAAKQASKPNYLPPIAEVEGGGIKRGLTAPEAGVILELPLNKVLALVIFGLLEKGLVKRADDATGSLAEALTLEIADAYRTDLKDAGARAKYRRSVAQQQGTVIHNYEDAFLDLIQENPGKPVKDLKVVKPMERLVEIAAAKMQGFDLSDTQDYYRRVIERAMEQAAALGDIEQREQYLDKYGPWVMLDKDYRRVMTVGGYNYWPLWARGARPAMTAGASTAKAAGAASSGRPAPKFGDVASSFAGWAETTMGGMAAAIMPTSLQKPAPVSTSSSSGGGFRSSCACACAGCACACACAGGGR